jgi:hypothetical protein
MDWDGGVKAEAGIFLWFKAFLLSIRAFGDGEHPNCVPRPQMESRSVSVEIQEQN